MSDTEPEWPEPQPDPEVEPGETDDGLLPSLERIRTLDLEVLRELLHLTSDWEGELVERFRERVAERLGDS